MRERRRVRPTLDIDAGPKSDSESGGGQGFEARAEEICSGLPGEAVDNDLLVEGKRNLRITFRARATTTWMSTSAFSRRRTTCRRSST